MSIIHAMRGKIFTVVCHRVLYLAHSSSIFFINDIFSLLSTCEICNYADDNTIYTCSRDFHQVQKYLKKDFKILENWFYDNYSIL